MRSATPSTRVRVSVVVPVFDASETLSRCLEALVASIGQGDEIIVADDGSRDGSVAELEVSLSSRIRSVRSEENIGRGPIRNLAASLASGDILLFVDSDVVVHSRTIEQVREAFTAVPERVAVIGSYDDRPASPTLVSQYRNLLHHHTHHSHGPQASHFWTGLGAVRAEVYRALGGFDEGRWARNMEDVEFGHRLVDAGHHIDVLPEIQATHLKPFTLRSMVETDLLQRAVPWSRLMLASQFRSDRFVASWPQRISAASAVATVASAACLAPCRRASIALLVASGTFALANLPLWRFLARTRSVPFALACVPLHLVYAITTAVGFGYALIRPASPHVETITVRSGTAPATMPRRSASAR
jgi:cellulose synthase/poly-beta-1,6-N-acetylglucosamine synthase-like glycosyltransferase